MPDARRSAEAVDTIGEVIRAARAGRFSIEELAAASGVSAGLISQTERGLGNPSVVTLTKLAYALGLSMSSFFATPGSDGVVVRADARNRLVMPLSELVYELLTPTVHGRLGMVRTTVAPSFCNRDEPFQHPGEECVHLLRGSLRASRWRRALPPRRRGFGDLRLRAPALVAERVRRLASRTHRRHDATLVLMTRRHRNDDDEADRAHPEVLIADREVSERMDLARLLRRQGLEVRCGTPFASTETEMLAQIAGVDVVTVGLGRVSSAVIAAGAPRLRLVVKCGIGTDNIDIVAARDSGVRVLRTSGVNFYGVAEYVVGGVIALLRRVRTLDAAVRAGQWNSVRNEVAGLLPTLQGATLGIIGFGAIGRALADLAQAHGMRVVVFDPYAKVEPPIVAAPLPQLLGQSDVVSVHAMLTSETQGLIGRAQIAQMKPSAILVNTSRGPIVDDLAVADALHRRELGGALLDVFTTEPPSSDHPILTAPNCILTPHLAGCTRQGYEEIGARAAQLRDGLPPWSPGTAERRGGLDVERRGWLGVPAGMAWAHSARDPSHLH